MKEIYYKGKTKLTKIDKDSNTNIWYFNFNNIYFQTSTFWRLYNNDKIILISLDDNLKYNYYKPKINLTTELLKILNDVLLIKIEKSKNTSDLLFIFEKNITLTFYLSSMAFENWNLHVFNKNYICLAGGEIAIFEK